MYLLTYSGIRFDNFRWPRGRLHAHDLDFNTFLGQEIAAHMKAALGMFVNRRRDAPIDIGYSGDQIMMTRAGQRMKKHR